jgi:uncharacterized hydrophobic protein (TIGR00271 family)
VSEPHDEAASAGPDLSAEEFQDYSGDLRHFASGLDFMQLLSPASLRGIAAIVASLLILQIPDRSPRTLTVLLAVTLVAWSVGGIIELRHKSKRTALDMSRVAVLLFLAGGLVFWPNESIERIGFAMGIVLIAGGLFNGARALRGVSHGDRLETLIGTTLYVAIGIALVLSPETVLGTAVLVISTYWFIAGVVSVSINIRREDDRQIRPSQTWGEFLRWIQTRPNTAADRLALYQKIFFEGDTAGLRLSRFFVLMGFAAAIATWGIIADSTAVVIGAMLIAPLMTPLMGTSLAMIMGWPKRAAFSALVALGGVLLAIGLSIVFGWLFPVEISAELNSQVASRVGPTLIDWAIAVFAGGAGAFALSRPDVSDSLPGVAVSIALVPPLSVIGLMISEGNWSAAGGATVLFVTNMVAILLVGALVFIIEGVVPVVQLSRNSRWVKLGVGMVAALALVVVATLGLSSTTFENQVTATARASEVVDGWVEGTNLAPVEVDVSSDGVAVTIAGSDPSPPAEDLADALAEALDRPVHLTITVIPEVVIEVESGE